jgi:DNA-binding MarR family transcriptional regulator
MTTDDNQQNPKIGDAAPRDLRLRAQFFPGKEAELFDTTTKGYVPLPILVRKLLRHLTPPELRVLVYLYTRSSKYRLCYPTIEEISEELGLNRKNVTPHLISLERKKLILTHTAKGRKYFLMLDPRVAIQHLVTGGHISGDELFMLNELCRELGRAPFKA